MTPEMKGFVLLSVIKLLFVFTVVMVGVALLTLMERKVSAWMQNRLGPNRVGPGGLLQPAADGLKNILKEETFPAEANPVLFTVAPALAFIPALMLSAVIPFAAPLPINSDDFGRDLGGFFARAIPVVGSAVGSVVTAKEIHRETGRSDCQWDGADGVIRFSLVGYWTGGQEGWKILGASRAMAKDIIKKEENANMDSIVQIGPVAGLGDKAVFSPLLPSLVLKDDVLLEFTTSMLPKPELQFRPLAMKALSRL